MSIRAKRLRSTIQGRRITMLGIGPMSKTVTTEAILLANQYKTPVALIPSRRQVDSEALGGGYVEQWSTHRFASFVRSLDKGGYVLLSRDHSGPWQGSGLSDSDLSLHEAMAAAKDSLSDDINCGFDLLHIDPSPALARGFSDQDVSDMAVELIAHCVDEMSDRNGCLFEVGTDEQDPAPESFAVTVERLNALLVSLRSEDLPAPLFYVAQTGTKVAETRNVGSFDQPVTVKDSLPATTYLPELLQMLEARDIMLKEHNADYLSDVALRWHRRFGIHAANVAPEFGVTETRAFIHLLKRFSMTKQLEEFEGIVIEGKQWTKWLLPQSKATDNDKVEIAGHYHFADESVVDTRTALSIRAASEGFDSEALISSQVRASIDRYLRAFGYGA